MKKISFIVIIFLLSFSTIAYSAETGPIDFSIGIKGITGAGFFLGNEWENELNRYDLDNNPIILWGGVLLLDMNFIQSGIVGFGLQPEFMYCRAGGLASKNSDDYDLYSVWLVDISLYLKFRFKTKSCSYFLLAGPSICMPTSNIIVTYFYNDNSIEDRIKTENDYCLGMGAGFGFDIPMGIGNLQIALIYKPYFTSFVENYEMKQNMVILSLGYSFNIVKSKAGEDEEYSNE